MARCKTYILFSQSLDRFYIGYTCDDMGTRLKKHVASKKGFTAKAKDWRIQFIKSFDTKAEAMKFEKSMKKAKSRQYIIQLIQSADNEIESRSTQ